MKKYDWKFGCLNKDGKFFTLDGKYELESPNYLKYGDFNSLSEEEKEWVIEERLRWEGLLPIKVATEKELRKIYP